MTNLLLPRIGESVARELIATRWRLSPMEAQQLASPSHPRQTFASVGTRIATQALSILAQELRIAANAYGYPHSVPDDTGARNWDALATKIVWRHLERATPADAARADSWSFMTTVLVPDLVVWRYRKEATDSLTPGLTARFLGGRRNLLRRFWLRGRALHLVALDSGVLNDLREDDLVQIFERPSLAAVPLLAGEAIRILVSDSSKAISARDVLKRLNRELAVTALYALSPAALQNLIITTTAASVSAFRESGKKSR